MKRSHPIDIWLQLVPAQATTAVVALLVFFGMAYLLAVQPLWIALPVSAAAIGAGAFVIYLVLDRAEGDRRRRHKQE